MWKMKITIILTFALLLLTPTIVRAHEDVEGMVKIVNGYHVRLILPDVVVMGENQFQVLITDEDGQPVSGAMLEVAAQPVSNEPTHSHDSAPANTDHDEMAGMDDHTQDAPAIENTDEHTDEHAAKTIKLNAAQEAGLYQGAISLSKDGNWTLTIHLMIDNEMFNTEFPLLVTYTTPAAHKIIAAFIGLNALIITIAAILRVKTEA